MPWFIHSLAINLGVCHAPKVVSGSLFFWHTLTDDSGYGCLSVGWVQRGVHDTWPIKFRVKSRIYWAMHGLKTLALACIYSRRTYRIRSKWASEYPTMRILSCQKNIKKALDIQGFSLIIGEINYSKSIWRALATACVQFWTYNLLKIFTVCRLTAPKEIYSSAAISLFDLPAATKASSSRSPGRQSYRQEILPCQWGARYSI